MTRSSTVWRDGYDAGLAAGSWVIDGNTSRETAEWILQGVEDGDPEVYDLAPSPLSGEHGGESIPEIFGSWEAATDTKMAAYEDGFSEGFWKQVLSDATSITGGES